MFATVDYHGSRFVKCRAKINDEWRLVDIGSHFHQEQLLARVIPDDRRLEDLARRLINAGFLVTEENAPILQLTSEAPDRRPMKSANRVQAIRVEVWGLRIASTQKKLKRHLINRVALTSDSFNEAG